MPISAGNVVSALNHPTRRRILRALAHRSPASASQLAEHFDEGLSQVSYHMAFLAKRGILRKVSSRQVRGATETFYEVDFGEYASWADVILEATEEEDRVK